jgi:hypothetical protein
MAESWDLPFRSFLGPCEKKEEISNENREYGTLFGQCGFYFGC